MWKESEGELNTIWDLSFERLTCEWDEISFSTFPPSSLYNVAAFVVVIVIVVEWVRWPTLWWWLLNDEKRKRKKGRKIVESLGMRDEDGKSEEGFFSASHISHHREWAKRGDWTFWVSFSSSTVFRWKKWSFSIYDWIYGLKIFLAR